jgi:hypothetical protein
MHVPKTDSGKSSIKAFCQNGIPDPFTAYLFLPEAAKELSLC